MKWLKCRLIKAIKFGTDELNNPILVEKYLDLNGKIAKSFNGSAYRNLDLTFLLCRVSPWSLNEISELGRSFTSNHRKLLAKTSARITTEHSVIVKGTEYKIDSVIKTEFGFLLLYISTYKEQI